MIHLLDTDTINKIAAGEVIERPASVVKELVENAIDAGASRINVEIENGGMTLIKVSDNGAGIERDDIRNAFVKHATSKISSVDDLNGVETLGFRGEALSSIAAVAEVSLLTKTAESLTGYAYDISAGEEKGFYETGIPDGTAIVVRNLFFNTPVRKKFLKSDSAEGAAVGTVMEHMALSRPDISFKLLNNGKEKLSTTGSGNLQEVIFSLYGRDIARNLIEINEENDDVRIRGFIGKPAVSRGNRSFENYSINGRYIKNDSVSTAIEEAYKGYIMLHNYPFTALLFEIAPSLLDVNVHPAKRELRLTASESVCAFIMETLRKKISGADIIPDVVLGRESEKRKMSDAENEEIPHTDPNKASLFIKEPNLRYEAEENNLRTEAYAVTEPGEKSLTDQSTRDSVKNEAFFSDLKEEKEPEYDYRSDITTHRKEFSCQDEKSAGDNNKKYIQQEIPDVRSTNRYRLLGQLFATYWLIEADDTFYMMDQHAAHEKILYERLMQRTENKSPQTQYLTVPEILNVTPETSAYLNEDTECMKCFMSLGYEIENFGDNTVKVTGIPAGLPTMDYKQMITDVLDGLCDKSQNGISQSDAPQLMIEKIASMSCKAAIKGNDRISEAEALSLISEMMEADNPFNCPHGRPTLIAMSKYEIEKKFKRIV